MQWKHQDENVIINTQHPLNTEVHLENKKLYINLESISEFPGKLKPGLVYLKDYIVLPFKYYYFITSNIRIYDLLTVWYPNNNLSTYEIKRMRIEYPEKSELNNNQKYSSEIKKNVEQKLYEVETHPIFIKYFLLEEIIKEISDLSIAGIKEFLSKYDFNKCYTNNPSSINNSNNKKLIPYSRATKFKEVQFDILNHYKQINVKSRYLLNSKYQLDYGFTSAESLLLRVT